MRGQEWRRDIRLIEHQEFKYKTIAKRINMVKTFTIINEGSKKIIKKILNVNKTKEEK